MDFTGGCHCGNLRVSFETQISPEEMEVRACQCTFCRRHAQRSATDPKGHLTILIGDDKLVSRYRFGLATSDFLICARCGNFVAAVLEDQGVTLATLNVNVLDERNRFAAGSPVDFDAEDVATRIARRRKKWTPATVQPARPK
jgi:hypothetical protein